MATTPFFDDAGDPVPGLFRAYGPMTLDQVIARYRHAYGYQPPDVELLARLATLIGQERLCDTGQRVRLNDTEVTVWKLAADVPPESESPGE
jgi:hypothetical protein